MKKPVKVVVTGAAGQIGSSVSAPVTCSAQTSLSI